MIDDLFNNKYAKRDPEYLEFIRQETCVCGCGTSPCDPHHAGIGDGTGGMGTKVPDYYSLPFCRKTHNLMTAVGWGPKRVAEEFNLDYKLLIIRHLCKYIIANKQHKMKGNGLEPLGRDHVHLPGRDITFMGP